MAELDKCGNKENHRQCEQNSKQGPVFLLLMVRIWHVLSVWFAIAAHKIQHHKQEHGEQAAQYEAGAHEIDGVDSKVLQKIHNRIS